MADELAELVELPNERLEAEYKDWLDLANEENRANVARHLAALANFGGGYLVFGFDNKTMAPTGTNPWPRHYSHDGIGAIIRKYLEPAFEIGIRTIRSAAGHDHVIVVVPPHKAVPICAKQNGPGDAKGAPRGITRSTYYTRKPLPESAAIITEAEWTPIIRRCVMHDRAALIGALTAVLSGRNMSETKGPKVDQLQIWHDALRKKYLAKNQVINSDLMLNNSQFTYGIATADDEKLAPSELIRILKEVNKEGVDRVNTGWSMFYPFDRQPISPYLTSDLAAGIGDEEFLEADLTLDADRLDRDADIWRVSQTGLASLMRPIRLDYLQHPEWSSRYFSLNEAARNVGQLVRHAQGLSERFDTPLEVRFICEWSGLTGRELADPSIDWTPGRIARTDARRTQGRWSVGDLSSNWPLIVADLIAPLARAFDPTLVLDDIWVTRQASNWRPIGNQWP